MLNHICEPFLRGNIGNRIEIEGVLIGDNGQCWMKNENDERQPEVLLDKEKVFDLIVRQTGIVVGGRYIIAYPARVMGFLVQSNSSEFAYIIRDLSSIVINTGSVEMPVDLDDNAGGHELVFE